MLWVKSILFVITPLTLAVASRESRVAKVKLRTCDSTNKQYKILLEQLELSTADFKKSLVYLEKLWKLEPGKKYASYFANIYARFGDEAKAKSYEKYLK